MNYWDKSAVANHDREKRISALQDEHRLLSSQLSGVYAELKDLAKKNPGAMVTDLVLTGVNAVITDAKALLAGDRYVDRIDTFVAAGENPAVSDVLFVVAQLRQACDRFRQAWADEWEDLFYS